MAKTKQVFADIISSVDKTPASEPNEPGKRKPVWRFSIMDFDGPFGCNDITPCQAMIIHGRLSALESMTWNEIERRNEHHLIAVSRLSKEARDRLNEIAQDDVEHLYSLRIASTERVWGIRDRHVLKLLWWDPEHKVYPVSKKHT